VEGNDDLIQEEKTRLCDSLLNNWNTAESIEIELVATLPDYPQTANRKAPQIA